MGKCRLSPTQAHARLRIWRPSVNEKQRTATREYWADPATRERKRAETKARWADPEERSKFMAGMRNPERRARIAAVMRARWADPDERSKLMAGIGKQPPEDGRSSEGRANETVGAGEDRRRFKGALGG
jgi:hypothetical protein